MSRTSSPTWRSPTSPARATEPVAGGDELRVLGVDPGSHVTGWGLVGGTARRPRLVDCGTLVLSSAPDLASRLAALQRDLQRLLGGLSPGCAAVESPFHGKDSRAALQLAHARGVILAGLAVAGVPVTEYTPATVKKAVTGNGRAPKDQVRRMVSYLLAGADVRGPSDVSDAVAVALCHAAMHGHRRAVAEARD